jgi:hypothetical protein
MPSSTENEVFKDSPEPLVGRETQGPPSTLTRPKELLTDRASMTRTATVSSDDLLIAWK